MRAALALALAVALPAASQASTWKADAAHTAAQFEVKHMMISTVRGAFSGVEATLDLNDSDLAHSKVTAKIPVATVDTREPKRDGHLKSPDFFDAANHPYITFVSTKIEKKGENRYAVAGDLTIRGVTRPVVLDVEASPEVKNPFTGIPARGFHATTTVNRKDFGLTWNKALETGGVLVGDEVKILLDVEFNPAPAEEARK